MPEKPDNPNNFWQELKRRKVVRVVIGYAAASYVLLELTSIIAEPLGLPAWTINLVLVLLCIGFVITVVVSWIYDFTPKGIEKTKPAKVGGEQETSTKPLKRKLKVSDIIISVLLVAVIVLVYPKIFKKDKLEHLRSGEEMTIAVMPFQNMTSDTTWNIWEDGIKDELITQLTNSEELKVRQTESINTLIESKELTNYASITPSIANEISRDLDADVFINGSIKKAGNKIRVNAQIFDSKTKESLKSFTIDEQYNEDLILNITDSLSEMVNNYLVISVLEKETTRYSRYSSSTSSPEAYRKFILARNAGGKADWSTAKEYLLDALKIDSNFTAATIALLWKYNNNGEYDQAKKICLKLYAKRNQMTTYDKANINFIYAWLFETPLEMRMAVRQRLEIDDQDPVLYKLLGQTYLRLDEYEKAIPEFEKGLDIYKKWDSKPDWLTYFFLGQAYHRTGQHRKARKLYRKAGKDFPDNSYLLRWHTIVALSEGKTKAANEYIEKYISVCKERSASEADIAINLGRIYWNAELFDKAEDYLREALRLRPESPATMNVIAFFLIDTERNITEGLELVKKALELSPDHYEYLDTKGWGLYKQGKYQEALDILQKSWDLRMKNTVYVHREFLHLEAAKKAVAEGSNEY
ncbi:MAG: tetratricopeptide repeat protein [Bacteroidota bacterium]